MANCLSCNAPLEVGLNPDTDYQYDNALWIGFHGGYGMFVDNLDAFMPLNAEDQWLKGEDGEVLATPNELGRLQPLPDPTYVPVFEDERVLSCKPDYEAVICHDCAHALCVQVPWIEKLLDSRGSHSHRTDWKDAHPEHYGWDYE